MWLRSGQGYPTAVAYAIFEYDESGLFGVRGEKKGDCDCVGSARFLPCA